MAHLLRKTSSDEAVPFGAKALQISDTSYRHSAAQFWSHLIDEIIYDYGAANHVILKTIVDSKITREHLFPDFGLNRLFEHLSESKLREAWTEACDELELLGSPNPVTIQIDLLGKTSADEFSIESIDSEIFLFFMSWLLKWSNLSEEYWNDESVQGSFLAYDLDRRLQYQINFHFLNQYLHEGLTKLILDINFDRSDSQETPK